MEAKSQSKTNLLDLPNEVIVQILRQLTYEDIHCNCAKVNKRFRDLAQIANSVIPHIQLTLPKDVSEQTDFLGRLLNLIKEQRPKVAALSLRYFYFFHI